jgi:hypothetical protein
VTSTSGVMAGSERAGTCSFGCSGSKLARTRMESLRRTITPPVLVTGGKDWMAPVVINRVQNQFADDFSASIAVRTSPTRLVPASRSMARGPV